MVDLTKENLTESVKQIESIIKKMSSIQSDNLKQSQRTLMERRMVALELSFQLMNERLENFKDSNPKDIIEILGEKSLSNATGFMPYKSVVFCVIDAIFSIRSKYNPTTINVLDRSAKAFGLNSRFDELIVSDFVDKYRHTSADELATELFGNRQRTSTSNGILKAEAVKQALSVFSDIGINTMDDFNDTMKKSLAESEWLQIKGQTSGVTWRYLCMLAGDPNNFKDDTHIYNFFIHKLGYSIRFGSDYEKLKKAFLIEHSKVSQRFPGITIAILDHMIWKYMSGN